jgi:spore maturation protein CgeB
VVEMEIFYFGLTEITLNKWSWIIRFCIKVGYKDTKLCEMSFMSEQLQTCRPW